MYNYYNIKLLALFFFKKKKRTIADSHFSYFIYFQLLYSK